MALDAAARRRLAGGLLVALALAMLVAGQTVLSGRLSPVEFMVYWLVCLLLTGAAIVAAFLDLRAIQRRNLREQRLLFHSTLEQIASQAKAKAPPKGGPESRTAARGGGISQE
jgi:hypothetical protein